MDRSALSAPVSRAGPVRCRSVRLAGASAVPGASVCLDRNPPWDGL